MCQDYNINGRFADNAGELAIALNIELEDLRPYFQAKILDYQCCLCPFDWGKIEKDFKLDECKPYNEMMITYYKTKEGA